MKLNHYELTFEKSNIVGDLIDSVKSHSSTMASWMKNTVSPTLKTILPASPGQPPAESQPSTSSVMAVGNNLFTSLMVCCSGGFTIRFVIWICFVYKVAEKNLLNETFAAPSTTFAWKASKSGMAVVVFLCC